MGRDALDDVAQIDERIDVQVLAGLDQRTQDGGAVRRCFNLSSALCLALGGVLPLRRSSTSPTSMTNSQIEM
jgi:hypothetical protein